MRIKTSNGLQVEGGVFRERECEGERGLVEDGRSQMGDGSGGLATGEEVGGEVVKFAGLETEGLREEADLDLGGGIALLAEETEESAPVKGGDVADDGSVLGQFCDLTGIGVGVVKIAGGID